MAVDFRILEIFLGLNSTVIRGQGILEKSDRYTAHWDKGRDGVPDENETMTMIEHILIHKSLEPFVSWVFIDHSHGSQLSDHWPVVVDLEID